MPSQNPSVPPASGQTALMIRVEGVTYDYPGHRALDNVSFALPPASVTALVGPNGAGKTTLLRVMAALEEPMRGHVFIDGRDIWENPREAHRQMGYLADHFGLYQDLSARQCLLYAAYARGLDDAAAEKAARWAAGEVGLTSKLDARAGTLSRGQRQRLALASAFVHRPKVLLLDEPASGLDPEARAELARLMKSLASGGMTLVVSSHILAELETYSTAMLALENGHLLAYQTLQTPATENGGDSGVSTASSASDISNAASLSAARRVLRVRLEENSAEYNAARLSALLEEKGFRASAHGVDAASAPLLFEGCFDDAGLRGLLRELVSGGWPVVEFAEFTEFGKSASETHNLQEIYFQALEERRKTGSVTEK